MQPLNIMVTMQPKVAQFISVCIISIVDIIVTALSTKYLSFIRRIIACDEGHIYTPHTL